MGNYSLSFTGPTYDAVRVSYESMFRQMNTYLDEAGCQPIGEPTFEGTSTSTRSRKLTCLEDLAQLHKIEGAETITLRATWELKKAQRKCLEDRFGGTSKSTAPAGGLDERYDPRKNDRFLEGMSRR